MLRVCLHFNLLKTSVLPLPVLNKQNTIKSFISILVKRRCATAHQNHQNGPLNHFKGLFTLFLLICQGNYA